MWLLIRKPVSILLMCTGVILTVSAHAEPNETGQNGLVAGEVKSIQWAINDAPPFHVLHGEYQREGICDVLTKVVHRYLPEQQAGYLQMPQPRIAQALDNKEPVCFPCMIYKPAGEPRAIYSLPTHLYYPHHIITNDTTAKTLRALYGEPVPLEELLDDSRFRLGYPAGRRYGLLQPLLNEHDPFLARAGTGGAVAILHMISSGRLDYTIDYPIVANYFQRLYNRSMVTLQIAENHQQPVAGAIGCANNAWGKAKVAEINRVMPDIRRDPEFLEVLQLWHDNGNGNNNSDYDYFNEQKLQEFEAMSVELGNNQ